jgi:hypothetical protein
MLPARAAKAVERIAPRIVAARHRNALDGVGHVLHRDTDEAVGDVFGRASRLARERPEGFVHRCLVERLVCARPEDAREECAAQLSHHHIGIGHAKRPAAAIAFGPRIGARGIGTYAKSRAVEMQYRSAARRDGMNRHHRHAQPHAGDLGFVDAFVCAVEARDIGGCAAHVETDHMIETGFTRRLRHADDATRRSGNNGVLAVKEFRRGQSAVRRHEIKPRIAERAGNAVRVARQHRR